MIFLQNRYKILLLLTIIIICFLLFIPLVIVEKGLENHFLAIPKYKNAAGVSADKFEELSEGNFLITYEVKKEEQIEVLNSKHNIVLIGTNYVYPYITSYTFAEGSFFTQSAQEHKNRTAVLNEPAAFELFGNYDIVGNNIILQGKSYIVAGVIRDEDSENKNVYIPITLLSDKPTAFMTYIDIENGITEEYIKNEFKELDVTESNYYFINFRKINKIIHEQALTALMAIILIGLSFILKHSISKFKTLYEVLKELLMQYYFKEILNNKPELIYKMIRILLRIAFCVFGALIIAYNVFKICINWNASVKELIELNFDCFINQIQFIRYVFIFSTIAFIGFIIILILCLVSLIKPDC